MSKQQEYQQLRSDLPDGNDYGFAARLPQAGGSCETDGACHANFDTSSTSRGAEAAPTGYPAMAYGGAPVTGYPVMTGGMSGPVGMGVEDPLGRRERKFARRQAKRTARARQQEGGRRGPPPVLRVLIGGPVGLLVGLARHAIKAGKAHQGDHPKAPAHHAGSSTQGPASHPKV